MASKKEGYSTPQENSEDCANVEISEEEQKYMEDNIDSSNSSPAEYTTRGVSLRCKFGTHTRRVNLKKDHGVALVHKDDKYYHPLLLEDDCILNDNINVFGLCNSPSVPKEQKITLLDEETNEPIKGYPCVCQILGEWADTKENLTINDKKVLTTKSFLVCAYLGVIEVKDGCNGLEYSGELDE